MPQPAHRFASGRRALVAVALCATTAGCIAEAPGTVVHGINESDHDVIVASTLHGHSLVLPAHTWGKLFDNYSTPSGNLIVFDELCSALVTLPLSRTRDTLHIGRAGEIELTGSAITVIPSGVHSPPQNGPNGGDFFAEKSCP